MVCTPGKPFDHRGNQYRSKLAFLCHYLTLFISLRTNYISGTNADTLAVIHEESADQWLVYKNLLLLRDCDNGGVVVFSKVPLKPSRALIEDALEIFGETTFSGQMACEEEEEVSTVKYYYYDDEGNNHF